MELIRGGNGDQMGRGRESRIETTIVSSVHQWETRVPSIAAALDQCMAYTLTLYIPSGYILSLEPPGFYSFLYTWAHCSPSIGSTLLPKPPQMRSARASSPFRKWHKKRNPDGFIEK